MSSLSLFVGCTTAMFRQRRTHIKLLSFNLRNKYTQHKGVKGIRSRKSFYQEVAVKDADTTEVLTNDALILEDRTYDEVVSSTMHITREIDKPQNVLIVQPYIKWAPKRDSGTIKPDHQLAEAEALIRSLPHWQVALALKVPLESLERKSLFGSGKLIELKNIVHELLHQTNASTRQPLTCLFISKSTLSFAQKRYLESEFKLPIMDRYSVVIQILRLHATSAEARLQVAMAELPYIWSHAKESNLTQSRKQGYVLTDLQREILKTRERKLKMELERIRQQRKLLRNKRKQQHYPIVAVVGYTNAGKTSLIKALTSEETMQPRDQLFATLDVTAHGGCLPCNLKVIYMDTVGFMSDLPTGLIECFIATLEDAMLADVILHVQDLSHPCHLEQGMHVETTLKNLTQNLLDDQIDEENATYKLPPIINVYNKIDLVPDLTKTNNQCNTFMVSSKEQTGLHALLEHIEEQILKVTNRRALQMRIRNGGPELPWLYKNATVVNTSADIKNAESLIAQVVITDRTLHQFKRIFCQ